jgi:hypothetical protein
VLLGSGDATLRVMDVRRQLDRPRVGRSLLLVAAALLVASALAFAEAFHAPARRVAIVTVGGPAPGGVTAATVRRWVDAALPALSARDRAAWRAALAPRGAAARTALDDLYRHLAPIPWTHLHATVQAIRQAPGAYDVTIEGRPGGAGPSDRVVAERVLLVARVAGRLIVTGDRTSSRMAHEYLMAFRAPLLVAHDGAVVICDGSWRPLADELAADMPLARADVRGVLGVTGDRPIVVFLYSTAAEVAAYLGQARASVRERFFARLPTTAPATLWWPTDVGVLASALVPDDPWTPHMLAHEVTHTLTWRWFYHTAHQPPLLLEGMATDVEDSRSYAPLRADVARGDRTLPLLSLFASSDLWSGERMARVNLAYLAGGALVKYLIARWGLASMRRFSVDVADTSLCPTAVKRVVRRDLGVSWTSFYAGWTSYVMTLP